MLDCIESAIVALQADLSSVTVVQAGDFNTLEDSEVISRGELDSIVNSPTRGTSMLDWIYVSHPCYDNVCVVTSTVKTDHNIVITYSGPEQLVLNKCRQRCVFRKRSPNQYALFLEHISELKIDLDSNADVQTTL